MAPAAAIEAPFRSLIVLHRFSLLEVETISEEVMRVTYVGTREDDWETVRRL